MMLRAGWLFVSVVAIAAAAGCQDGDGLVRGRPVSLDRIDRVNLWAEPMAINWDRDPAPDGVNVRVYLYRLRGRDVQTATGRGEIELLLFEGADEAALRAEPFHTWRFTASELKPFLAHDAYGLWCHQMGLPWGDHVPTTASVTMVARYIDTGGSVVTSAPASILVRAQ